jgi:tetratricopeptide (TPR) repeat protein
MDKTQTEPPAAPAEEKSDRFNNLVTLLILITTVWTAYIAYIQSYDGDRQGDAARDSQVASLNALTSYSKAIQQNSYDAQLLARYDDATIRSQASSTSADDFAIAGDTFNARQSRATAERLLKARDVVRPFSPAFTDTRLLDEERRPDLTLRNAELFEPAYRAEESQIMLSRQSSAVAIKANAYVLMITMAAVALFLFGLSLTVSTTFVRILFVGLGSLIVAGCIGWFFIVRGAPEPSLTDEAMASFAQGRVAYEQGKTDDAIKAFSAAIEKAGGPLGYARAYQWRGQAQVSKQDYSAAVADFGKAIELEPDADAYGSRGWAYVELKEYAKAESDFKRAVELSPESDDDINSLGWAQYLSGNYAAAIDNFNKAIKLNDKYPLYPFNLGVALLANGDVAGGKSAYEAGLRLTENKPVELVGWQLDGAISDLENLGDAPAVKITSELSRTAEDLITQIRTRLVQAGGVIDAVIFSSGADGDQPADKLTVFDPGTQEAHVFIEFSDFVDGAVWSDRWTVNGQPAPELSTEHALWNAGTAGATHFSLVTDEAGLAPGEYKVEIRVGDKLFNTASFRVRPTDAQFGDVVFAQDIDAMNAPVNPGYTFEKGIREIKAFFDFANMQDNLKWSALWWHDGTEIDTGETAAPTWTFGVSGTTYVSLSSDELPPGQYNLVLLVEGDVFQEAQFKIVEPSDVIRQVAFAPEVDADGMPISATDTFPADTRLVYATFDYAGIQPGQSWSVVWYLDGVEVSRSSEAWHGAESGNSWVVLSSKNGLPPGQYDLELSVDGKVVQTAVMLVEGGE